MTKESLLKELETIRLSYLEDLRHSNVLSEYTEITKEVEELTPEDLEEIFQAVVGGNCSEHEDVWYTAGCIQSVDYMIGLVRLGEYDKA